MLDEKYNQKLKRMNYIHANLLSAFNQSKDMGIWCNTVSSVLATAFGRNVQTEDTFKMGKYNS